MKTNPKQPSSRCNVVNANRRSNAPSEVTMCCWGQWWHPQRRHLFDPWNMSFEHHCCCYTKLFCIIWTHCETSSSQSTTWLKVFLSNLSLMQVVNTFHSSMPFFYFIPMTSYWSWMSSSQHLDHALLLPVATGQVKNQVLLPLSLPLSGKSLAH